MRRLKLIASLVWPFVWPFAWMSASGVPGCNRSAADIPSDTSAAGDAGSANDMVANNGVRHDGSTAVAADGGCGDAPRVSLCSDVTPIGGWSCVPNNYHDPLVSFVELSSSIFRGTVTALHAQTPGLPMLDTSRTVIVHVDKVLKQATIDLARLDVTIELLAAPTMAVGYQGYFFAQTWLLGGSIALTEVTHIDPGVYSMIESDVAGIQRLLADERLYARMLSASAVVVGTVTAIAPLPGCCVSEHDPMWVEAAIDVDCSLRGVAPACINLAFATGRDYLASPKLTMGQQGIFLVQPAPPGRWPYGDAVPYVVVDTLDVQPLAERAHVANLVLCPPQR